MWLTIAAKVAEYLQYENLKDRVADLERRMDNVTPGTKSFSLEGPVVGLENTPRYG